MIKVEIIKNAKIHVLFSYSRVLSLQCKLFIAFLSHFNRLLLVFSTHTLQSRVRVCRWRKSVYKTRSAQKNVLENSEMLSVECIQISFAQRQYHNQ